MRRCSWLLATLLAAGCSFERRPLPTPQPDTGALDAGLDARRADAPATLDGGGFDGGELDGGLDAPFDAGMDALPFDALPFDALPFDGGMDAPFDAGVDVPLDAPEDTPPDAPEDTPPDAPEDTPPDVPLDVPPDVPEDTPPDVPPDVPPVMPDAGPTLRSCGAIYGTVPGYALCAERDTECEFYRNEFFGNNCSALCSARGGVALTCYNNAAFTRCTRGGSVSCTSNLQNEICICSRIP